MRMTETVKQLLIINILFFVGTQFAPIAIKYFSMFYPESPNFRVWQLITHMFMHGGIAHIFFNMFALYSFGSALEHFWGGKKFLFFYISCGLGAALLHTGVNYLQYHHALTVLQDAGITDEAIKTIVTEGKYNTKIEDILSLSSLQNMYYAFNSPVLGASGAVYGLLTAFAFMFPNAELALMFIPIPIKAKYFVPIILSIDLVLGFGGSSIFGGGGTGIAHFAHLGGAITGFLMMWYWKKNQFNQNRWN